MRVEDEGESEGEVLEDLGGSVKIMIFALAP